MVQQPLVNFIGDLGCFAVQLNLIVHNVALVVGGAGMAFFRLISYQFSSQIENMKATKNLTLVVESLIIGLDIVLFLIADYYMNSGSAMDFCRGHTKEMSHILAHYEESGSENLSFGRKLNNYGLIIPHVMIIFEFICYAIIMICVYMHDRKMAKDEVINKIGKDHYLLDTTKNYPLGGAPKLLID